jgi:hypothetical protein
MNFRAIQVLCMAISTIMDEISWAPYGPQGIHTPLVQNDLDCHKLDLLLDMMGTLTRMMDTRVNYVTTEGKVVKEWILSILELGARYKRELDILEGLESKVGLVSGGDEGE